MLTILTVLTLGLAAMARHPESRRVPVRARR